MDRPDCRRPLRRTALAAALLCAVAGAAVAQDVTANLSAYAPATGSLPATGSAEDADRLQAERTLKGAELEALQRDLLLSAEKRAEIAAEIAALEKDRATINDRLVSTAARVQALETSVGDSEARLARLQDDESNIRASLESRRAVLAEVLAAAQRIGRRPPPALVVKPEDALGAVRSAIVLGSVLPELRIEADALTADLAALVEVRSKAEAERDHLMADAERFAEERQRLAMLVEEKKALGSQRAAELEAEEAEADALGAKAKSLEELMSTLERRLASVRAAERAAEEAARMARPSVDDTGRLQPAVAFADAKGRLQLPVRGVSVQDFGQDNGLGGLAEGLSIVTRAGAQVTAPADSWVVYAGPFRSYGQLLILNAGDGYHVVLAGMERIDVELGQFVLSGEPVGVMGTQRLASAAQPDTGLSQPVLYIEFRKDGASIDPTPWWVGSQDRKVRG